jgi:hypothetical protein
MEEAASMAVFGHAFGTGLALKLKTMSSNCELELERRTSVMMARALIDGALFGPDALKVICL